PAARGEQAHQVPALVDDGLLPLGVLGIRGGSRAFEDLSGAVGEPLADLAGRGTARDGSVVLGGAGDHRVTGAAGGSLGHRSDRDGGVLVAEVVLAERRGGLRSLGRLL